MYRYYLQQTYGATEDDLPPELIAMWNGLEPISDSAIFEDPEDTRALLRKQASAVYRRGRC